MEEAPHRALSATAREPAELAPVLDALDDGVALFGPDGRIRYWNAWLKDRTGLASGTAAGRRIEEIFPTLAGGPLAQAIRDALGGDHRPWTSPEEDESPLPLGPPGDPLIHTAKISPFPCRSGEAMCVLQVRDVSPVARSERLLARQAREVASLAEAGRIAEDQLRAIVDHAALGILTIDRYGIIDLFNPAAERMFATAASRAKGGYASRYLDGIDHLLPIPPTAPVEIVGRRPDGGTFPVSVSLSAIGPDTAGGFVCLVEDIGRRKQMESVLRLARDELEIRVRERTQELLVEIGERRRAEERLRKLSQAVEQSPAAVLITDTVGAIEYVNPRFEAMTGYRAEEVIGQTPRILKSGRVSDEAYANLWQTIGEGGTWHGEIENRGKDGRRIWVSASISPIRGSDGTITHFIGVQEDITDRKRAEKALIAAKEQAERANRTKSEFLANMSHELRTPLHAVLSYARLGQDKAGAAAEPDLLRCFDRIHASGYRLLALLNDLLDLSKLEAGHATFDFEAADLKPLVRTAIDDFQALAQEKNLSLSLELPAAPAVAVFDARRLAQVVRNLLANALRFSPDGGHVEIHLVAGPQRLAPRRRAVQAYTLTVVDRGIGIPAGELETIFEKFVQGSHTRTGAGGTGLGLAISRQIVAAHGGRIWAEHNPEGGSIFTIALPAPKDSRRAARASGP